MPAFLWKWFVALHSFVVAGLGLLSDYYFPATDGSEILARSLIPVQS